MPAKSKTGFCVVNSEKSLQNKLKEIMSSNYMSNMKSLFRFLISGTESRDPTSNDLWNASALWPLSWPLKMQDYVHENAPS
jgi:hypothetical protein